MESRNFRLDTEWNIIHYPEKPQGFGILVIGDERHFVDQNSSFWLQNEGKKDKLTIIFAKQAIRYFIATYTVKIGVAIKLAD